VIAIGCPSHHDIRFFNGEYPRWFLLTKRIWKSVPCRSPKTVMINGNGFAAAVDNQPVLQSLFTAAFVNFVFFPFDEPSALSLPKGCE
jgi:hypothetical protein